MFVVILHRLPLETYLGEERQIFFFFRFVRILYIERRVLTVSYLDFLVLLVFFNVRDKYLSKYFVSWIFDNVCWIYT